uniref:Abhydro_lipase domain-containing protein n=1 Tax=Elaeophora elaphi TaxID=1147741 RepID=A0A0R3RFS2_9BILA
MNVIRKIAALPIFHSVEIILYHGYPVQVFHARTDDGYILDLHRIPYGCFNNQKSRPVIFLQHGLLGSSADWVENFPNQSFGIFSNELFWEFSWDQMAKYDLDATFDVILSETKEKSLYYVGFSQGTLIMFAKLSQDPKFASKIRKFFALGPVATVANVKGLFRLFATKLFPSSKLMRLFFGKKFFTLNSKLAKMIAILLCKNHFLNPLCSDVLFQIAGPGSNQFNQSRLLVYIGGEGGTSVMNMIHWMQMVNSGKMQAYNYESVKQNQLHYGRDSPPIHNVSSIDVPIYLYWSKGDWLATAADIQKSLLSVLPNSSIKTSQEFEDYNHLDFIWGLRAPADIYQPIISIIHKDKGKIF